MARGVFTSEELLYGDPKYIPVLAERLCSILEKEGYEAKTTHSLNGSMNISLTKGGIFKKVLGLKTALNINMIPRDGNIFMKAGIGIFGQQAVPTVITLFVFWPAIITQIWGMVQQSELDDKVIKIAEEELYGLVTADTEKRNAFHSEVQPTILLDGAKHVCPACGATIDVSAKFCSACGGKL